MGVVPTRNKKNLDIIFTKRVHKVCYHVEASNAETLYDKSNNTDDNAQLDMKSNGFWLSRYSIFY